MPLDLTFERYDNEKPSADFVNHVNKYVKFKDLFDSFFTTRDSQNDRLIIITYPQLLLMFMTIFAVQKETPEGVKHPKEFQNYQEKWIKTHKKKLEEEVSNWHNITESNASLLEQSTDPNMPKLRNRLRELVSTYKFEDEVKNVIKTLTQNKADNKDEIKVNLLNNTTVSDASVEENNCCPSGCVIA